MSHPVELVGSRERTLFGPDLVKDVEEKMQAIRENLKMAQMSQKSYHDKGTASRHFEVEDYVYLKVPSPKVCKGSVLKGN
jgi:3-dehydroquinate dehydratase